MFFFRRKPKVVTVPRTEHTLSRKKIEPEALKILYRLASLNYDAYLVGGSVRDLLLGRSPKDFDIGTDARPNEIKRIFRNCFLVGKRFRLAHIVYGKKVFETATFRKAPDPNAVADEHGLYQSEDNNYGTPEEDARRRDFTVNGLFYDIKTFSIIDYVGGLQDLKAKVIRSIGEPSIRFQEDPVRMMRAIRFAAKLGFEISSADIKAIRRYAPDLANASVSRLCEEVQRLCVRGATERSFRLAYEYRLLHQLIPTLAQWLDASSEHKAALWASLAALDKVSIHHETTTAVAFAALFAPMVHDTLAQMERPKGKRGNERYLRRMTAEQILEPVVKFYKLPRAVWMTAVDIIELHHRFTFQPEPGAARDVRFVNHALFREILMGAELFAKLAPKGTFKIEQWRAFYKKAGPAARLAEGETLPELPNPHSRRPRRRRPRHRHGRKPQETQAQPQA